MKKCYSSYIIKSKHDHEGRQKVMINNIKFNEWQEMSLNKEVESIAKTLKKEKKIDKFIFLEIFLAAITLVLDSTDFLAGNFKIMLALLAIAFIPLIWFVVEIFLEAKKRCQKNLTYSFAKSEYVNDFDNKVCYWVMTATSFLELLKEKQKKPEISEGDESISFLFQETNFYVNKSIDKLHELCPDAPIIFSTDLARSKKIYSYRLVTVLKILKQVRKESYSVVKQMKDAEILSESAKMTIDAQREVNNKYDKLLESFENDEQVQHLLTS